MNSLFGMLAPHVHWGLRLSLAATFLFHAYQMFPVADFSAAMGFSLALSWAVVTSKIVAGIALLAGPFTKDIVTRIGAAIVIVIMIGAISIVHLKNGFNVMNGGFEFQLLMLLTGLYLLVKGNDA